MSIFEYTKVHIINTLCITKIAFRALILSLLFISDHIFFNSEQEKPKKNLGKYNKVYPYGVRINVNPLFF
jgi:hypothetical protein